MESGAANPGVNNAAEHGLQQPADSHFVSYGLGVFLRDDQWQAGVLSYRRGRWFCDQYLLCARRKAGHCDTYQQRQPEFFRVAALPGAGYLNLPYENMSRASLPGFTTEQQAIVDSTMALQKRVKGKQPPLPLSSYAGNYSNELFGNIQIGVKGTNLQVNFDNHKSLTASLQYMDNETWLLTYSNIAFGVFPLRFAVENNR